jgi:hypothetical protein
MKWFATVALALLGLALPSRVLASPIVLQEYHFNVNGTQYENTTAVAGLNAGGFNTATGLGDLILTFTGAPGAYFFDAFFDHQLHVPFYNEWGLQSGVAGAGVSWQVDEPGFGDKNRTGTIFTNTKNDTLDNINHVPGQKSDFNGKCGANGGGAVDPTCNNDVSMAMGFHFVLGVGEQAVISLHIGQARPASGFYLAQFSPGDGTPANAPDNIFFTGDISIGPGGGGNEVPEPASLLLIGTGLVGVVRRVSRKGIRQSAD